MDVSILIGDIADARTDAVCTSTNPRLSLMMGTGASVRGSGGFQILRECEAIVAAAGGSLPVASAHVTTAGNVARIAIHCVASDDHHRSSEVVVRDCTAAALTRAAAAGCSSVAMPVFATGHARVPFASAVRAMSEALRDGPAIERVVIVVTSEERAREARPILETTLARKVPVEQGANADEPGSFWSSF
ncbi:MAG TPA: macro domain-containing protein [Thermoanaerobaculia bacterium]|nr:macro domain-containing protein [Thermoanaerobaculia bacterium]